MIYDEDPFRRRPENRWPGENDRRGLSEWRKIWPNGLPDEGQSSKPGHRMAAEGMPFPWWWNGGTIPTDLDVIWGMSVEGPDGLSPYYIVSIIPGRNPALDPQNIGPADRSRQGRSILLPVSGPPLPTPHRVRIDPDSCRQWS